jgi:hypothetical protein
MTTQISLFEQPTTNLPAHLSYASGVSSDIALGGMGRNRIGLKGSRFRLIVNGQEEAVVESSSIEVVIVGAAKGVGRIYYGGDYDPDTKTHPLCYSADGIAPGSDVTAPQAVKCAQCPQNQKGSKITQTGQKTKACTYFKRLAVVLLDDPAHRVFQLDGKALTIFGEGEPARNQFTLNEYSKKLNTRGWDVTHLITKLSFDTKSSVPKLYFSPVRLVDADEAEWIKPLINSEDVQETVKITAITDTADAETEAPAAAPPPPAPKPAAPAKPQPIPAKAAPAPAAKAEPVKIVKAAPKPPEPPKVQEVESSGNEELDDFLSKLDDDKLEG